MNTHLARIRVFHDVLPKFRQNPSDLTRNVAARLPARAAEAGAEQRQADDFIDEKRCV
jgi:hypothetical protein